MVVVRFSFLFLYLSFIMLKFWSTQCDKLGSKVVNIDCVRAEFVECWENSYDVSLDINSQKFLVRFSFDWWLITSFEIVSFKWFMINLTNSLVIALRNLVDFLRSKLQ